MPKLFCVILLFSGIASFSQVPAINSIDTIKLVSVARTRNSPTGWLKIWSQTNNQINYEEAFDDRNGGKIVGQIRVNKDGSLTPIYTSRFWNGTTTYIETTDSLIFVNDGERSVQKINVGNFTLPKRHTPSLLYAYLTYALSKKITALQTSNQGKLHFEKVGSTVLNLGATPQKLLLYIVRSDSSTMDLVHMWLNEKHELVAIPYYENTFDLIVPQWQNKLNDLLQAEIAASWLNNQPTCAMCDSGEFRCKLIGTYDTLARVKKRSFTLSDNNGYSVTSDGKGSYVTDWENILIPAGRGCGLHFHGPRFFIVDLNHPVKGDKGKPLGMINVNGMPGSFIPTGAFYRNEIMAQLSTDEVGGQYSFQDLIVGKTEKLAQLDFDLYVNGLHYVMQMGPQPYGHCFKTKINGNGTTQGTIKRISKSEWMVDLPPGSKGRLFDNHNYDYNAVDKGLYYVSMHFVIKTLDE